MNEDNNDKKNPDIYSLDYSISHGYMDGGQKDEVYSIEDTMSKLCIHKLKEVGLKSPDFMNFYFAFRISMTQKKTGEVFFLRHEPNSEARHDSSAAKFLSDGFKKIARQAMTSLKNRFIEYTRGDISLPFEKGIETFDKEPADGKFIIDPSASQDDLTNMELQVMIYKTSNHSEEKPPFDYYTITFRNIKKRGE